MCSSSSSLKPMESSSSSLNGMSAIRHYINNYITDKKNVVLVVIVVYKLHLHCSNINICIWVSTVKVLALSYHNIHCCMKVHCGQTHKTHLSKSTSEALFWMSRFRFLNKRGLNHEHHRVITAFRSNCVTAFLAETVILRLAINKAAHALSGSLNLLGTNLNWELSITCSIWPGSYGSSCKILLFIFKRTLVLFNQWCHIILKMMT